MVVLHIKIDKLFCKWFWF